MALSNLHSPPSIRFEPLHHRHQNQKLSFLPLSVSQIGLNSPSLSLDRRSLRNRFLTSFSASHEDSKHAEIEVEKTQEEVDAGAKESQEAWEKMLESFKEQAMKMQGMSKEAYEIYSKKAAIVLDETSKKLKIQAEKTSQDLSVIAKEISEESKVYLSEAAKNSPEEIKDVVDTLASSPNDLKEVSKVRDFYLGIPYGAILSFGGFLSFMITGNTSAIRFGVILGGIMLYLGILSLRSWKKQESSDLALKGQTAIAAIIFLRELRLVSQRPALPSYFTTLISGAMALFFLYRIMLDGDKNKGSGLESGSEN